MNYYTNRETDTYEDIENEKKGNGFLIIFAILMVIFAGIGIYFLIQFKSYDHITGYTLTTEYVSNYCRKSQCLMQGCYSLISAIIMLISIISACTKKGRATRSTGMNLVIYVIAVAVIGFAFIFVSGYKTYKVLTNEPTVSSATIVDMHSRRGRRSGRSYYFKFSDGAHLRVSRNEYTHANIGDEYYIAYFDGMAVECFDADTYSLPE